MNIKQQYLHYKNFLEQNQERYEMAEQIVSEGVTEKTLSVEVAQKIHHKASSFMVQYLTAQAIVNQLKDLGVHYIARESN